MKRLKIKSGQLEIELESDDLEGDLAVLFKAAPFLLASATSPVTNTQASDVGASAAKTAVAEDALQHGINTYVARLNASSAREIMRAASYHLTLNDGTDEFSKEELYSRCKEVRDWKADYSNQQAVNLHRMVKSGELTERAGGKYCVPRKVLEEARTVLAND
jgi:hypothetical protein